MSSVFEPGDTLGFQHSTGTEAAWVFSSTALVPPLNVLYGG